MSAVVDFVADTVSDVADFAVGAVSDVADFVVDDIIKPVADVVVDTVKKVADDPLSAIAMVASVAFPPFAPLIMGANTLAHGGDLSDALKGAALAYVGGQAAAGLGGAATTAALDSGLSTAAAKTIGSLAGNVGRAAVTGGDPLAALVAGGVGAGVNELAGQIPGFTGLPPEAQRAVTTAMSAELQGKDASQALVNQALNVGLLSAASFIGPGTMPYNYDPANNPADPNADSNPDLNGSVTDGIAPNPDYLMAQNYDFAGNYGLSNGTDITSGLSGVAPTTTFNTDGSINYNLAQPSGSGQGLQMPIAPTLSDMGGGYGLITPVDGGYMTSLGFVPSDSSSILGDPASFINDPNVLGKTVIGQDTLRAPTSGVTATSSNSGGSGSGSAGYGMSTGFGSLGATPDIKDPAAIAGRYDLVGNMGYDTSTPALQQLYDSVTSAPKVNYAAPTVTNNQTQPNLAQVQGFFDAQRQNQYYAQGGAVQHFAEGDQPTESSTTTVSTAGLPTAGHAQLLASLKSLGALGSDIKMPQHNLRQVGQSGMQYSPRVLPQLAAILRSRGMNFAEGGRPDDRDHPNFDGSPVFRTGGLEGLGGKYVEGKGDGTSDDISAMLANGEYVFSADVVAALGNGSNKAGADKLGQMVEAIRARARSAAPDKLPPDAKSPLEYLKSPKGKKNG